MIAQATLAGSSSASRVMTLLAPCLMSSAADADQEVSKRIANMEHHIGVLRNSLVIVRSLVLKHFMTNPPAASTASSTAKQKAFKNNLYEACGVRLFKDSSCGANQSAWHGTLHICIACATDLKSSCMGQVHLVIHVKSRNRFLSQILIIRVHAQHPSTPK